MPKLAVIAFPGNNCETETARAARRNGFESEIIRWNQSEKIGQFEAYILPGGFSFEDRGRSGALAAREPIFDCIREEAKKGKLILGICNGAQMVVESGLIPINNLPLPLSLAENVRHDANGHVVGTGYYNTWCYLQKTAHKNAFTNKIEKLIKVPIAHGEGRFTTQDVSIKSLLQTDAHVALRYVDECGNLKSHYPTNPNGALQNVAMIVNKEGTIGAIMPHPERFYTEFDGDFIFASMREWINSSQSPQSVEIGNLNEQTFEPPKPWIKKPEALYFEKKLVITDNAEFSVQQVARDLAKNKTLELHRSLVFEVVGLPKEAQSDLIEQGFLHNQNKEHLQHFEPQENTLLVSLFEDDYALVLSETLSAYYQKPVSVKIFTAWGWRKFNNTDQELILRNGLLCNPHGGEVFS